MFKNLISLCSMLRMTNASQAIPSYCTANMLVIEAILEHYKKKSSPVLIEATSNQVNQMGGYTGMTPAEYHEKIYELADKVGFNKNLIMLAGDHLGPLPWAHLPANEAMANARQLVRDFVLAGYEKIHLDTSIRLADDEELTDDLIASRGVDLYITCQNAWNELREYDPDRAPLTFIIGSEVPPAGGSISDEITITSPHSLNHTIEAYRRAFAKANIKQAWDHIAAVVVQPGVEYGNMSIRKYNREDAQELCNVLKKYPLLCFEGHSTDFQPATSLRKMAEDGISILKVGPALTFSLREALFNLCLIEHELIHDEQKRSKFRRTLLSAMNNNPKYWEKYYHGSTKELAIQSKFSYLDRSRYYLYENSVEKSIMTLIQNIDSIEIPAGVLHQYCPMQYYRLYSKGLPYDAKSILFDYISIQLEEYDFACELHKK